MSGPYWMYDLATQADYADPGVTEEQGDRTPCDEPGCTEGGQACYLPDDLPDDSDEPHAHYCAKHAEESGFCRLCGVFSAGIESLEFRHPGVCDNCYSEIERAERTGEDGWWDESAGEW